MDQRVRRYSTATGRVVRTARSTIPLRSRRRRGLLKLLEAASELIIGPSSLDVAAGETEALDSRRAFDGDDQGGLAICCGAGRLSRATKSRPGAQQSLLISFGPMIDAMTPFSLKTEAPYGR